MRLYNIMRTQAFKFADSLVQNFFLPSKLSLTITGIHLLTPISEGIN